MLFVLGITLLIPFTSVNCNKQKRTQIILISIDTLRGDHLSSYGYKRDTSPNLSKLIKESVYYKYAYTNGCWTYPSHMSLLTGTLPSRHGANKHLCGNKKYPKLNGSIKSISEILKNNININTIKFAKLPDEIGFSRGFEKNSRADPFANSKKFSELLKELENNKEKNFFLFIHTWMAHAPYTNSSFLREGKISQEIRGYINKFRKLQKKTKLRLLKGKKFKTSDFVSFLKINRLFNVHDVVTLYDSGIKFVDQYIGKIIDKSRQLGIYDNLMILIVSDHGEHFEEHIPHMFYDYHGQDYYEEFIKVPLIIKYPRQSKGEILNHPVSLIDVFPTILDYYKIKIPAFVQGDSLLMPRSKKKRKYIISEAVVVPGIEKKMIRIGDFKYIITMKKPNNPGRVNWENIIDRKLFNLKSDPLEKKNLYKKSKFKKICINFEKILKKILKKSISNNRLIKETKLDKETIDHMKSLGYL